MNMHIQPDSDTQFEKYRSDMTGPSEREGNVPSNSCVPSLTGALFNGIPHTFERNSSNRSRYAADEVCSPNDFERLWARSQCLSMPILLTAIAGTSAAILTPCIALANAGMNAEAVFFGVAIALLGSNVTARVTLALTPSGQIANLTEARDRYWNGEKADEERKTHIELLDKYHSNLSRWTDKKAQRTLDLGSAVDLLHAAESLIGHCRDTHELLCAPGLASDAIDAEALTALMESASYELMKVEKYAAQALNEKTEV